MFVPSYRANVNYGQPLFRAAPKQDDTSGANAPSSSSVLKVALTGGIASGKSMVGTFLRELGVDVIEADHVVHELLSNNVALKAEIRAAFGDSIFDAQGNINRKKLGSVVFADDTKRKKLEAMIHPKVRAEVADFFEKHKDQKLAVADIPLLFESNLADFYDAVWLVKATKEQQLERMITNRGMTRADAEARLNSQMSLDEKQRRLEALNSQGKQTAVIDNSTTIENTKQQITQLASV